MYRYEYVDGQLTNPLLLLDLTATPLNDRAEHNGGKVLIGSDKNVYVIVGEVGAHRTQAQNIEDGPPPNGLGGVLRITQDGQPVPSNPIFGDELPLNLYYAMGIRNSFGMDFDPLTGNLWDTENGPTAGDEINLVGPGFNSGFALIQGYADDDLSDTGASADDLVLFGDGYYDDPKFAWTFTVGVTALKFLNSDKLGSEYANNMLVGDINNGLLYRFILNGERDGITIQNDTYVGNIQALSDNKVEDTPENRVITFGQGFGGITDIQVGPGDGYPYVLSYTGSMFKILPAASESAAPVKENQPSASAPGPATSSNVAQNDTQRANSVPAVIIGIRDDASYAPNPIEISAGQTITWVNGDAVSHTVTSGTSDDSGEGELFDSDAIIPDQNYSLTFDDPGNYEYYCIYHPTMVGEVNVVSGNGDFTGEEDPGEEDPGEEDTG
ncbi:MAG: PQQ-dependent sugar dehydrogenase [Nitrosopumilus sp.]|nr:PQQ-dependent sugar dehydrogenase [Nitrosopumilus sp.]